MPQNSSTDSKVMTFFSNSFRLSPCRPSQHGPIPTKPAGQECQQTFPLGGLVNHSVHLFVKGWMELKCSLSWKTVTGLPESSDDEAAVALPPSGEMGMVVRSTCSDILTNVALSREVGSGYG